MYSASDQECLVARVVEPRRQECAATIHQHRLQQRQQLQQQQRPAPLASACRASRDARYGRASAYAWTAALALVPRTCCCSGGGGCVREQTNEQQQRRRWIVCVFVVYQVPRCATRGARSWVGGQVVLTPWHPPRHRWRSRTWPRLRVPRANRRSCRCAARPCLCGVASELHSFKSQRISTLRGRGAASTCVLVEACASTCPPMGFFGSGSDFESAPVSARLALACESRTCDEAQASAWIGHHVVGNEDSNVEFVRHLLQHRQHAAELLLSLGQLASTRVVDAEQRHDRVDDQLQWTAAAAS